MDKKIIKGLIDEKLEVIQEQFSIIREYEGKIPIIELDLIMTNIRDLYELILSLQVENMGLVTPKPASQPQVPKVDQQPVSVIKERPAEIIPEPEIKAETEAPKAPEPVNTARLSSVIISMEPVSEEKPAEVPEPVKPAEPVAPEPTVSSYQPPVPEPPSPATAAPATPPPAQETAPDRELPGEKYQKITLDLFSEGSTSTLADRFREGQDKRIADKLQENKIMDLRTTIGINDKFLFINELFDGDMHIYDEAILKLNASTTLAQADIFLLDLKIVYNWDSESPTVKKFVELVRRKF